MWGGFRARIGLTEQTEWDRFPEDSAAGEMCTAVGGDINNPAPVPRPIPPVPRASRPVVTTAPDVSISTNLGGWINKKGVYAHTQTDDHGGAERLLKWAPAPGGQVVPDDQRRWPVVNVHDASSHSLAWLGSALGRPQTALGVDRFGESGTIADLHELTGISAEHIVTAAILAIS